MKNKIRITIGMVVTKETIYTEGFEKLVELSKRTGFVLMFILPVPIGEWDKSDVLLEQHDIDYLRKLAKDNANLRTDFDANYFHYGCGAGKEILYLTPYGDVLACPFIHVIHGNIFDDSLENIRNKILENKHYSKYHLKCLCGEDEEFIEKYIQ